MGQQELVPPILHRPLQVAARSKAWVFGHSLSGFVGYNPAGGMNVCSLWLLCVIRQRALCRADHSSREILSIIVTVTVKCRQSGGPGPLGALELWEKSKIFTSVLAEGACTGLNFGRFNLRKEPPLPI